MIDNGAITLGFTLFFLFIIIFSALIGLIRGMRKSIYCIITFGLFFVLCYFISIPIAQTVVDGNFIQSFAGIEGIPSELTSATSLREGLYTMLESDPELAMLANENLVGFICNFVISLVRLVIFFFLYLVIGLFYNFVCWILWLTVFRGSREQREQRKPRRLIGAGIGVVRGILVCIIIILPFGGFFVAMNDIDIDTSVNPETLAVFVDQEPSDNDLSITGSLKSVASLGESYMSNPFLGFLTYSSLPGFDGLMSMDGTNGEEKVSVKLREEVTSIANAAVKLEESGLLDLLAEGGVTSKPDISPEDIETVMGYVGQSKLISSLLPICMDVVVDTMVEELNKSATSEDDMIDMSTVIAELYKINWLEEFVQYGKIMADFVALYQTHADDAGQIVSLDFVADDNFSKALVDFTNSKSILLIIDTLAKYIVEVALAESETEDETEEGIDLNIASWINITTMTREDWKADILGFGSIGKQLVESGLPDVDYEALDFSSIDPTKLKSAASSLVSLKMIQGKQGNLLNSFFRLIEDTADLGAGFDEISADAVTNDMNFDEWIAAGNTVDQWNQAYSTEVGIIVDGLVQSTALFNLVNEEDISLQNMSNEDIDSFATAIKTFTTSKLLSQVITTLVDVAIQQANFGKDLSIPANINWVTEIDAIANIFKGIKEYDDIFIGVIKLNPQYIIDSDILSYNLPIILCDMAGEEGEFAGTITIPYDSNDSRWHPNPDDESDKGELFNLLAALAVLIPVDATIDTINSSINLSTVQELNDAQIDTLLASDIVHCSVSNLVVEQSSSLLVIPNTPTCYADGTITISEFKKVFKCIGSLDLIDEDGEIALDMDGSVIEMLKAPYGDGIVLDLLLDSEILSATVGYKLISICDEMGVENRIIIPNSVKETITDISNFEYDVVGPIELEKIVIAVNDMDIVNESGDFNDFEVDMILNITDDMLDSKIIHASISKQIVDNSGSGLVVPNYTEFTAYDSEGYISKEEISYIRDIMDEFDLVSSTGIANDQINASLVYDSRYISGASETVLLGYDAEIRAKWNSSTGYLKSKILTATISQMIDNQPVLEYPDAVKKTSDALLIPVLQETEIVNTIIALNRLSVLNAIGNIDGEEINIGLVKNVNSIVLDSLIIRATLSSQIEAQSTQVSNSKHLVIPNIDSNTVYDTNGFITSAELLAFRDALNSLAILDEENIVSINASLILQPGYSSTDETELAGLDTEVTDDWTALLQSKILQASFSKWLWFNPYFPLPNHVVQYTLTDTAGTKVVTTDELIDFIVGSNRLNIIDGNALDNFGVSFMNVPVGSKVGDWTTVLSNKWNKAMDSYILRYKASNIIYDQESLVDSAIKVDNDVEETISSQMFVLKTEIVSLIVNANQYGLISDIRILPTINSSMFTDLSSSDWDTIAGSGILHRAISDMLVGLSNADTPVVFISTRDLLSRRFNPDIDLLEDIMSIDAISNFINSFDLISGIDSSGNVSLGSSQIQVLASLSTEDANVVLDSNSAHLSISKMLFDYDTSLGAAFDIDHSAIEDIGTEAYVKKESIVSICAELDALI